MQKMVQASDLRDPQDDAERVQKEEWLVLVGVCTYRLCTTWSKNFRYER